MIQKNIRDFNGTEFSVIEATEWHKEFNDRTKSIQNGYNSIDNLATKLKALELTASTLGITDISGLQAALASKENAFTKNTAFNKNFGTTAGTVSQGNHNHDGRYYTESESNARFVRYGTGSYSLLLGKNGSTSDWLRTTSNGLLPYQSGESSSIGTSSWNFNTIYGKTLYENNVALSNKYLGKTAKAVDSDKLDGLNSSDFIRSYGRIVTNANSYAASPSGFYGVQGTASNTPEGSYQVMINARNSDVGFQLLGGHTSDDLWYRGWSGSGSSFHSWRRIWHNGNDGSGSGLDADLWDGYHLSKRTDWLTKNGKDIVVGQLAWNNYGNRHTIFDASKGITPTGVQKDKTNPDVPWTANYPTLMGYNGSDTYGVRVDSARKSDTTVMANNSQLLDGLDSSVFLRSNADDSFSGKLIATARQSGVYGTYNSTLVDHIWSMGAGYKVASDGSNFGNLYGIAYKHTNNSTGGAMAGGHQAVWCENGSPKVAMGSNGVWTSKNIYANSGIVSGLRFAAGYDAGVSNSFSCSGWFRSNGATGWYNASYSTGIYSVRSSEIQPYNNSNLAFTGGGRIRRYSHVAGFLEGSYNTVGGNASKTNPIYTIGSSYIPSESALGNMYGIGYSEAGASAFLNSTDLGVNPSGWGLYVASDGNARIFLNAGSGHGYFLGHIYANQGIFRGNVTGSSDRRLKTNITTISNALEKVIKLNGCTWDRKDMKLSQAGVIAQDLEKVLPIAVTKNEEGILAVDQGNALSALLIEAIKELKTMIDGITN